MADPPAAPSGGGGGGLTRQLGPLKVWQWIAVLGAGLGAFYIVRQRQAAAASSSQNAGGASDTSGLGPLPGLGSLEPVIIQQGPPSVGPINVNAPPPPTPAPPRSNSGTLAPPPNITRLPGEVIAASLRTPQYGATAGYYLTNFGGIEAVGGAPFWGSYLGLPAGARQGDAGVGTPSQRIFTSITAHGNNGYTITDKMGETYTFGKGVKQIA